MSFPRWFTAGVTSVDNTADHGIGMAIDLHAIFDYYGCKLKIIYFLGVHFYTLRFVVRQLLYIADVR